MILLTLSRGKGEETVRLQLPASPAEIGETFAFLDRISLDTDALQKSGAKTVNVTVQKDGVELTFKTSAESLKGLKSQYSTWYIAPSDRLQFRHLFGAGSDYSAEDIIRIAYGRSTLYEAPSAPAEDIEMQGMSL